MENWSFLTNHARVLLCIAGDPGARLRDIAASLNITERSAYSIITDLSAAGYVVKQKHGRRNRYQIQAHLRLPEPASREPAIGDVLAVLAGESGSQPPTGSQPPPPSESDMARHDVAEVALPARRQITVAQEAVTAGGCR